MLGYRSTLAGTVCVAALWLVPAARAQENNSSAAPRKEARLPDEQASRADAELLAALAELRGLVEQQSRELEAQRVALREQQERVAALERRLQQAERNSGALVASAQPVPRAQDPAPSSNGRKPPETQPAAAAAGQQQLGERLGKLEAEVAAAQKSTASKLKNLGNFAFSGDIRLRWEPTFGGGVVTGPSPQARHRERVRLRFNVNAKFNEEWSGGFSLATGDPADPISTNQTFTDFFHRKPFLLEKAFARYNPKWFQPLTLTAGKFAYTWYQTELTLDNDLNPEGLSESLSFDVKTPIFKKLVLVGFQLPFGEVSGGPDSFMQGGQVQTHWKFGDRLRFTGYVSFYEWNRADAVRAAQAAGSLTGNVNFNSATATQFASKFGILDVIARADVATWSTRWPLMLQFDFANNTRACTNLVNISGTPPPCNPRDRSAYWAEVQLGRLREVGDFNLGYTFMHIEREAVLGGFNFSDIRAATNVAAHRFNFGYQTNRNINLGLTGLFGRQLVTATSPEERFVKRFQVDLVYKF